MSGSRNDLNNNVVLYRDAIAHYVNERVWSVENECLFCNRENDCQTASPKISVAE